MKQMNDKEITMELAKNKADEIIVRQELDSAKQQFINELNNGLGEELKMGVINKPIRLKKPFKLKVKEFFSRISKTMGN